MVHNGMNSSSVGFGFRKWDGIHPPKMCLWLIALHLFTESLHYVYDIVRSRGMHTILDATIHEVAQCWHY